VAVVAGHRQLTDSGSAYESGLIADLCSKQAAEEGSAVSSRRLLRRGRRVSSGIRLLVSP
jgi:hypothetical protein